MSFVEVTLALGGVVGALLWFTGWAEHRVIDPDARPIEADTR